MQDAISKFVPTSSKASRRKKLLWMTGRVLRTVKRKHTLWKKWKRSNNDNRYNDYKKQAIIASKSVRLAKRNLKRKYSQ